MKLWEYKWFQSLITFCRKWGWFDTYIYGKSISLEDFVRNPAEVLRDTIPPFVFKNVNPYSVLNLRMGYIPYDSTITPPIANCWSVPMGDRKLIWKGSKYTIIDLRIWNKWYTKYCNSMFYIQFAASFWHYIPIPYFAMNFRIGQYRYFQFGLGWGAQINTFATSGFDACLSAKLRYVNQKTSNEGVWNPSDVVGYYEGTI